jgi:hypothetical protein
MILNCPGYKKRRGYSRGDVEENPTKVGTPQRR